MHAPVKSRLSQIDVNRHSLGLMRLKHCRQLELSWTEAVKRTNYPQKVITINAKVILQSDRQSIATWGWCRPQEAWVPLDAWVPHSYGVCPH